MWSGQENATSRPQPSASYYSSSSLNRPSGVRFEHPVSDASGYPSHPSQEPPLSTMDENTAEEILDLEGKPGDTDDEGSDSDDYIDFGNNIRTLSANDVFESINFPHLFEASNEHSERIFDLAKQFFIVRFFQLFHFNLSIYM